MIRLKPRYNKIVFITLAVTSGLALIAGLASLDQVGKTTVQKPPPITTSLETVIVANKRSTPVSQDNPKSQSFVSNQSLESKLGSLPPTPATVLNLINWKLTLPVETSHAGNPDEIRQPELASFSQDPYFRLNEQMNGVVFRANVEGATTKGSTYPRSELREMTNFGKQSANWSSFGGTHTMIIKQAITHLPDVKPEIVAGQIHDASDDVIMVRLEGKRLFIEGSGQVIGELDPDYSLGTVFSVIIVAGSGRIKVYYNDVQKVDYAKSGQGYYFKAGCYTQSNLSKGDQAGAYGEVVIYDLQVSHY